MKNILIILAAGIVLWGCAELTGEDEGTGDENTETEYYSTAVSTAVLPEGDTNCPNGGISISTGIDTDGNGLLDTDEVDETQYLCHGANGANGADGTVDSDVAFNTSIISVGDIDCPDGGVFLEIGIDDNGDGILDPDEVDSTRKMCNGLAGTDGADGTNGTNGIDGIDGIDNHSIGSIYCGNSLVGSPAIWWSYSVHILNSGDVVAQGSIYTNYFEVSKTTYYSSQQVGAINALVVLTYDLSGSFNYGYWTLELDRDTLITTVRYNDVDYTPNPATWVTLASDCIVNIY